MIVQLDTNILTRLAMPAHPHHELASRARRSLESSGHQLSISPQNLFEFWAVATRPEISNGLGLSVIEATAEIEKIKLTFVLERDYPTLLDEWERLVVTHDCKGKSAHDARIVAAMNLRNVTHLMTFNLQDFVRFQHITLINPAEIALI